MSKRMESPTAILRAFRTTYGGKSVLARMRLSALAATIYTVWNARNRTMFDEEDHRIEDLAFKHIWLAHICISCITMQYSYSCFLAGICYADQKSSDRWQPTVNTQLDMLLFFLQLPLLELCGYQFLQYKINPSCHCMQSLQFSWCCSPQSGAPPCV